MEPLCAILAATQVSLAASEAVVAAAVRDLATTKSVCPIDLLPFGPSRIMRVLGFILPPRPRWQRAGGGHSFRTV